MKKTVSLILTVCILLCAAVTSAQAWSIHETPGIVGDVSGDGNVEIDDATFLQRKLVNMTVPFEFNESTADADEDGEVSITDATFIQRWVIGMKSRLNIGEHVYNWKLDKSAAVKKENSISQDLTITRICKGFFYASPIIPLPTEYKIYGRISDEWCVGDKVYCTINNVFCDKNYHYIEGDLLSIEPSTFVPDPDVEYKPVIYLYPEEETEVSVKLDIDGEFLYTYPEYNEGWTVTASPDGTLTDESGKSYPYLFWEAKLNTEYDFSSGFCVKGEDTEKFLRASLAAMGLNESETDDFIDFWLSFMQDNPYNVISFQTEAFTDAAKLDITPQPDTTIRVFMAWYASDEAVDIPTQTLVTAERNGFTAVEWGGRMCR